MPWNRGAPIFADPPHHSEQPSLERKKTATQTYSLPARPAQRAKQPSPADREARPKPAIQATIRCPQCGTQQRGDGADRRVSVLLRVPELQSFATAATGWLLRLLVGVVCSGAGGWRVEGGPGFAPCRGRFGLSRGEGALDHSDGDEKSRERDDPERDRVRRSSHPSSAPGASDRPRAPAGGNTCRGVSH